MKGLLSLGIALFASTALAQMTEVANLKVTGGAHAGTYTSSSPRGGCSVGLTTPGAWGNQLSTPKDTDPSHFNSLQLIMPDPKKPSEFFLMVGFGSILARSAEYKVETRPGKPGSGTGAVHIDDHGTTAKISFDATTKDGIKLDGTIDCNRVIRMK